jgi:hypothetical protein
MRRVYPSSDDAAQPAVGQPRRSLRSLSRPPLNAYIVGRLSKRMACDLSSVFQEVTERVPEGPPGMVDFVFRREALPIPPAELHTDLIVVRRGSHGYNSWYRADTLWIYLDRPKARQLGVFLLSCMFHRLERPASLLLANPESQIRRIVVPAHRSEADEPPVGLDIMPMSFRYYPSQPEKHPWLGETDIANLPLLALTNIDDCIVTDEEWAERDTIRQESSHLGTVRLAELLLNAGCSWNRRSEYDLEGDAGFRGVAPLSAEVKLLLPGADGW